MNTIGDRLRFIRSSLKLSRDKFALSLGIARSSLQKYEENQAVPGGNVLKAMCEHGFNTNWILTGQGDMQLASTSRSGQASVDVALLRHVVESVDNSLKKQDKNLDSARRAKLYGFIYEECLEQRQTRQKDENAALAAPQGVDFARVARVVEMAG